MNNRTVFSKKSDNWSTPNNIYMGLVEMSGYMDPCPLNHDMSWDGLKIDWKKEVFVNPPYSDIKVWLLKGLHELMVGNSKKIIFLIPARTDTKWFHDLLYKKKNVSIEFIKGRLRFSNSKENAPFPSMFVTMT